MVKMAILIPAITVLCLVLVGCESRKSDLAPPRPPITTLVSSTDLEAYDTPGDAGGSITLAWRPSPTENTPAFRIRDAIQRQQRGKTAAEQDRIHREITARYARESKIEYRVFQADHQKSGEWS